VAWANKGSKGNNMTGYQSKKAAAQDKLDDDDTQVYQRVGLTDAEAMQIWEGIIKYAPSEIRVKDFARAIESKLKEKNT